VLTKENQECLLTAGKIRGKHQGEPESGKQGISIQERIDSGDQATGQFEDNLGPSFMSSFRIRTILRECRPTRGRSGNQAGTPAAAAGKAEHPGADVRRTLEPERMGWHAESAVVPQQTGQCLYVVPLEGGNVRSAGPASSDMTSASRIGSSQ
jgi:hypothetical protein